MQAIEIPALNLALSFVPLGLLYGIFYYYQLNLKEFVWATFRMLIQLLAVGYFLTFLFSANSSFSILGFLLMMVVLSSWIALRSVKDVRQEKYKKALLAQILGSTPVLLWIVFLVIPGKAWAEPRVMISLAGMVYANSMNTVSLAAERFALEIKSRPPREALIKAFTAAFIPQINGLLAVGLVSLPGMMTGQILSGVDPLIAVRYQIVVMTLISSAAGLSSFLFLWQWKRELQK